MPRQITLASPPPGKHLLELHNLQPRIFSVLEAIHVRHVFEHKITSVFDIADYSLLA
jgi:hypothetical protein